MVQTETIETKEIQPLTQETIRRNMLWNIIGSTAFIGAQWLMTILIVRLAGYSEAGYLSLGLSLTNIFTNIAYFCIRNFQVSDEGKYSQNVYVTHRLVLSILAFDCYAAFVGMNAYPAYVLVFLLLFMLYRLNEAVVDVFHGIDQRAWRLDIAGRSFLARGILTLLAFIIVEAVCKNLVITTAAMLLAAYAVVLLYDIPQARKNESFCFEWDKAALLSLTKECLPLFIYAICLNAVVPIPRYFLEKIAGSEVLGYYASATIPASLIQLLASYIYTSFTKLFADYRTERKKKEFLALFWKLTVAILATVLLALAGSALLGEWVLVLIFTESIRAYAYLLVPTIFCCGMIAFIWFVGTILTILRDMKGLLIGAALGVITAAAVSYPCIKMWGVDGVNVTLFLSSAVTLLWFLVRFWQCMKRWRVQNPMKDGQSAFSQVGMEKNAE